MKYLFSQISCLLRAEEWVDRADLNLASWPFTWDFMASTSVMCQCLVEP